MVKLRRMKYCYDTEFHEDGITIDLISIGIVCEDGREFYAVSSEADYGRIRKNSWLMENVMPSIEHKRTRNSLSPTGPFVKTRAEIRDGILEFVGADQPDFWAWYADYDHVALCQLFGKMIDLPRNFPMFTRDIRQLWETKGCPAMPEQPEGEHNALEDARHNMVRLTYLEAFDDILAV